MPDITPFRFDDLYAMEQRGALALRRGDHLLGDRGPAARYERRGNPLYELALIITMLAGVVPAAVVVARFLASARAGWFGWRIHADGHAVVRDLVDTYSYSDRRFQIPRGMYFLRPTLSLVEDNPEAMRARKSTWRRWIAAMGWEVPAELLPPAMVRNETEAGQAFMLLIEDERASGYAGSRAQHRQWAKGLGPFHVTNKLIGEWRKLAITKDERRGGRRRGSPPV
jgi:hypothetical protein